MTHIPRRTHPIYGDVHNSDPMFVNIDIVTWFIVYADQEWRSRRDGNANSRVYFEMEIRFYDIRFMCTYVLIWPSKFTAYNIHSSCERMEKCVRCVYIRG